MLLVLLFLLPAFAVGAEEETDSSFGAFRDGILQAEMQRAGVQNLQALVDTAFVENPTEGAEWYTLALTALSSGLDFSRYADALIRQTEFGRVSSAVTEKKLALVLLAIGRGESDLVTKVRGDSLEGHGIMNYVFALHLLNNGVTLRDGTAESVVEKLLSFQLEDGGWAISGKISDTDVTAMLLQALAPYAKTERLTEAIDKALARLSSLQKEDGDFASYGVTNPESTAQVIMALTELGIHPLEDARFVKNGKTLLDGMLKYRLDDGSFCHSEGGAFNRNATVQAFCALTAVSLLESGEDTLYQIGDFSHLPMLSVKNDSEKQDTNPAEQEGIPDWKWYALGCILLVTGALLLLFWKKKKQFSALVVALAALLLVVLLFALHIQTPDEYYRYEEPENPIGTATLSIVCNTVAGRDGLPDDGVILAKTSYSIGEGDSVYDLLLRATKANRISVATSGSYSVYVRGIEQLYEFSYGDTSGWVYTVNQKSPSVGCDQYTLKDGDEVVFSYTLTLGMMEDS